MTREDFVRRIETDPDYRRSLVERLQARTITEEEVCYLLDVSLGPPPRKWARTARTTPYLSVLAQLYVDHRQRPFLHTVGPALRL